MATRFISAKYDADTRTVDYVGHDGSHLLRTGGTIAWRFNNPGNIRPADDKLIMGAIGIGTTKRNGRFLIFASYEEGRAQKKSLLRRVYNDRTIYTMLAGVPDKNGKIVMGYAPANDNNDPVAYAAAISKHTGLPVTTRLRDISDAKMDQLLDAMEVKEGFNNEKSSRQEKCIATTSVTVSDGSRPKPNVPAQIKVGETTKTLKTDASGQLPVISHLALGNKVEIFFPSINGEWEKQLEFKTGEECQSFVLFHDLQTFEGRAEKKRPRDSGSVDGKSPIRYVVQQGDTLGKLAKLFDTTPEAIRRNNPEIKDISRIYEGQVLGIYGKPPPLLPPSPSVTAGARLPPQPTAAARSKKGTDAPLAIVPVDQARAPWMAIAIVEARRFAGKEEDVITKDENYHKDIGVGKNLVTAPWCASFVNYCLMSAHAPFERSASSQFPVWSKKFIKIDEPVYGALMVMRNYVKKTGQSNGTGHVTFVYGQSENGSIAGLGGNQGNSIKISEYQRTGVSSEFMLKGVKMQQKFHGFYIPATYLDFAKKEPPLSTVDITKVNQELLKITNYTASENEGTR
ncbi:hypothetical protein GCM10027277_11040 [Pseudoduganella ginsengisoli]|uniref:TIGR02594 family protein n=1 Tax=Pseudoduganella ginsengisoli TaxID=1462440 RepID=A0A6L6PVI7_9BURK|nr:TIGR02594 family protein [Pseudoduganella ginsengisoli]MTW01500.1 TIGR02594 family protein [Pseudoduganella ginsengisoli]